MTAETTLAAGRELDALVAAQVMGYAWVTEPGTAPGCWMLQRTGVRPTGHARTDVAASRRADGTLDVWHWCPAYSTDIAAAWEVVEAMRAKGWRFALNDRHGEPGRPHWAEFATDEYDHGGQAWEADAPLAICRAALAAVAAPTPARQAGAATPTDEGR